MAESTLEMDPLDFPETPDRARELLRLTLADLGRYGLTPNPVNYALLYAYEAGHSQALRKELEQVLAADRPLDTDLSKELFRRHVFSCDTKLMEQYREELLQIVAQTLGSVTDFATEVTSASGILTNYADQLASCDNLKDILQIAANLIADTRRLAHKSRSMEQQMLANTTEIAQLRTELQRAREEAETDALTGLLNRRAFSQVFERCVRRARNGIPVISLLLLDIDHFKRVNDTYGHLMGDQVLRAIAQLLTKTVKGRDQLARVGGEEFAILLCDTLLSGAHSVAEDIRRRVEIGRYQRAKGGAQLARITVSLGVAAYCKGESWLDFYARCDRALYQAKREGRNRVSQAVNPAL